MNKYVMTMLCCVGFSASCFAELQDAKSIRAVWDMTTSCKGVVTNGMSRSPNESAIKASKEVLLKDLGLRFKVPQLPFVDEAVVKLLLKDTSRGVTDHYVLISDRDLRPPFASVVITELPASMTTREHAFSAVYTLEHQLAKQSGTHITFEGIDGPHGKSLEMIVNNRVGSYCFPTSDFKFLPKQSKVSTVGVSRFSFIKGRLVEFSLIVTIPKSVNKKEAVPYAKGVMDGFWSRLTVLTNDKEKALLNVK